MNRYAVVDLSNLISRCRHVTKGDAHTKAGMALQILFRSLRKLHRENSIDHIVFAVDAGSWRYDVYPQYKARRNLDRLGQKPDQKEESEIFRDTLKKLVTYLHTRTRCTVLECKGVEGDDFVARWTQLHPGDEHIIVSADSDFVQLIAPNVSIYDGVQDRMLRIDGVTNAKGERVEFSIKPEDGKVKVGVANPNFVPEAEWWRKALFVKLIRGDAGDGIFAAAPGVRFKGTTKREGISEAWEDRVERGYHWNNFFQQEWMKLIGVDDSGEHITKSVKVADEYHINVGLIDLTAQPEDVKLKMDTAIAETLSKTPANAVGIHFIRFCGDNELPALEKEASDHAKYLNAGYSGSIISGN